MNEQAVKTDNSAKIAAIRDLQSRDHGFLCEAEVRKITEPFGFVGRVQVHHADPTHPKGLTFADPDVLSMKGADAADLAEEICRKLGIDYPALFGRGSRLRTSTRLILEHLGAED